MLEIERVWQRISQRPEMRGQKITDWGYQGIALVYEGLTSAQEVDNQQVNFPNGAIIVGVTAGAQMQAQAATVVTRDGLDMFKVSFTYQQQRTLVGQVKTIASSVFGTGEFDQFPPYEIVIPTQGQLIYGFKNLTTSTIDIFITHHCLVPVNVG